MLGKKIKNRKEQAEKDWKAFNNAKRGHKKIFDYCYGQMVIY